MITARQKVLTHFSKTRTASTREISRALKMSLATVRHHLRILVSDGRLERVSVQKGNGRGRPEKVYSLPNSVLGDNLLALSEALFVEAGLSVRVEVLARHLAGESDFKTQTMVKRLNLVVEKLNQMKYHGRWEAGSGGPRIIFGHCPYAAIITKHPELCRMDKALLQELMGQPVEQLTKIGVDGSLTCIFETR
jgi:predicted ArsR family transcriptional regulator